MKSKTETTDNHNKIFTLPYGRTNFSTPFSYARKEESAIKITIDFDNAKADAIEMQLEKSDQNIEQELTSYLQKLYEKIVPKEVRTFIEYTSGAQTEPEKSTPKHKK